PGNGVLGGRRPRGANRVRTHLVGQLPPKLELHPSGKPPAEVGEQRRSAHGLQPAPGLAAGGGEFEGAQVPVALRSGKAVASPELGDAEKRVYPLKKPRKWAGVITPRCIQAGRPGVVVVKREKMEQAAELDVLEFVHQADRKRFRIWRS